MYEVKDSKIIKIVLSSLQQKKKKILPRRLVRTSVEQLLSKKKTTKKQVMKNYRLTRKAVKASAKFTKWQMPSVLTSWSWC